MSKIIAFYKTRMGRFLAGTIFAVVAYLFSGDLVSFCALMFMAIVFPLIFPIETKEN